ncbi:hypothetical protein TcWFU_008721 [Taenia crassiceps]|uniref:C2H2-type domain-containing protein n=1 Tax=Taenia crassiceps TaxID=6207 RepID=A0ABR4QIH6_9CEST
MAMSSTSNSAKSCLFCGQTFGENNELWKHITSGTCNTGTKAEVVLSASQSVSSIPLLPKPLAQADSLKNGTKRSQNGSPDVFGYETSAQCETGSPAQPCPASDAARRYPPLQSTSKGDNCVLQGPLTVSGPSLGVDANAVNSARRMPQREETNAAAECHRLFPPLSAPSVPESTAFPATVADYGRPSNLSMGKDVPSRPVSSQPGTAAPVADKPSAKWKCTLCDVEFLEKSAMVDHVRSQEHEARIQVIRRSAGDAPLPTVPRRESASPGSLTKDELVEVVRQVVAEELPELLRRELRAIFNAALKEPSKESVSGGSVTSSSPPDMNLDANTILSHGNSIRCTICDCSITSSANLGLHVDGKKHKYNLARLANGRGTPRPS